MKYIEKHLNESIEILGLIDKVMIERVIQHIAQIRKNEGRIFFIGVGGSAANCSHAVNDFRKIAGIECYAPTDNVSELTARTNDEGWSTVFSEWLKISKLNSRDLVFVLSVGGGNNIKNISSNIVTALDYAKKIGATIVGIVGRDGGYTLKVADSCILIPSINEENVTPHAEAFQSIIWHLIVSHPMLKINPTKWESVSK